MTLLAPLLARALADAPPKVATSSPLSPIHGAERCWYCGQPLTHEHFEAHTPPSNRATRDHTTPRSKSGTHTVPACVTCNEEKGTLHLEAYRALCVTQRMLPAKDPRFHGERNV